MGGYGSAKKQPMRGSLGGIGEESGTRKTCSSGESQGSRQGFDCDRDLEHIYLP